VTEKRSLTPHLPTYSSTRDFLKAIEGIDYNLYRVTEAQIQDQRGSQQANVDWSKPDEWIEQRLKGELQTVAFTIWNRSQKQINPRHMRWKYYLSSKHNLLQHTTGTLQITEKGREFLKGDESRIVSEIDEYEGLNYLLGLVAEQSDGKRSDLLPDFTGYCLANTNYASEATIKTALYNRLVNLLDRQLVERDGTSYTITNRGLKYLDGVSSQTSSGRVQQHDEQAELRKLAKKLREQAQADLSTHLSTMNPYRFEALIQLLLQEMGYNNVEVTSPTNDKGVDVVADIQLGISSVREVVQVKRYKGNLSRPVLDQLRGSLHRFNAVRGTIISTGGYSKGMTEAAFERGAAPITLIDGKRLVELLIQYRIGVKPYSVEYLQFDPALLPSEEPETTFE
jgi:restriction system protein